MFNLTNEDRFLVINSFLQLEGLSLKHHELNEVVATWDLQSKAPLQGIKFVHSLSTLLIKIFGIETGLFICMKLPGLGSVYRTWLLSLIGMSGHEH